MCHRAHKTCSQELLLSKTKQIKLILNKNEYPQEFVNKTNHFLLKNFDEIKTLGPEKLLVCLKLPFFNKSSDLLKIKLDNF